MGALTLWGIRLSSLATGYAVSEVADWFSSGSESIGSKMIWVVLILFLLSGGLIAFIIWDKKR